MALLSRISDYLWSYVSPRKTQKKREKPNRSPTSPSRARLDAAMRIRQWREKQKQSRLERENSVDPEDLEGDTLIDASFTGQSPSTRLSPPGDELEGNDTTIVMDENEYSYEVLEGQAFFDPDAERLAQEKKAEEMRDIGWSESAIEVFLKMDSKGREPLLPKTWELDFESLPDGLFSAVDEEVFIKSLSGGDFRASLSLAKLVRLGPNLRDAIQALKQDIPSKSPEEVVQKAVDEYVKWACADADLKIASNGQRRISTNKLGGSLLPLLIIEVGALSVGGAALQDNALKKLIALGEKWKKALYVTETAKYIVPLPTLYAVVATYNTVGIVAYDIDASDADGEPIEPFLRTITIFDFVIKGHDVWNSLNLAILAVHVRNELCELQDSISASLGIETGRVHKSDDPDA